jgi:glycine betaine/proline transport system substrate-binding protein
MHVFRLKKRDLNQGGRTKRRLVAAAVFACVMLATACAPQEATSSGGSEGIPAEVTSALQKEGEAVFIDGGYMENSLQAYLMTEIVTAAGGKAKVIQANTFAVALPEMSKADNMAEMDFWRWQAPDLWDKYVEQEKTVISPGTSDYKGEEGWYVPTYVIKGDPARGIEPMCPGLPDWKALNECVDVFKTSQTGDKGQYMTGAESWAPFYGDQDRIDNLKLNYKMVFAGSEAALFAELTKAYDRGQPWLGLMWRPNFMTQKYDLTRVEFPPYTDECWETTHACQWPETIIYQLASAELETARPTVWRILQNYDLPDERLAQLQSYVIEDGMSIPDAAKKWVDENPDVWKEWLQ